MTFTLCNERKIGNSYSVMTPSSFFSVSVDVFYFLENNLLPDRIFNVAYMLLLLFPYAVPESICPCNYFLSCRSE